MKIVSTKIIAGRYKGSVIDVPDSARPTLSRSRQALFDVISNLSDDENPQNFFQNKVVLDCFAGSGALGIEALSRGALFSYFIDASQKAISVIYKNIEKLNLKNSSKILKSDVLKIKKFNEEKKCDLVFIDPPYGKVSILKTIIHLKSQNWIDENSIIVTEEDANKTEKLIENFILISEKKFGNSIFKILKISPNF